MTKTASLHATVGLGALMIAGLAGAREQPAPSTAVSPADELSEVVVTAGFRESLVRAANIKRNEATVSDVIAAANNGSATGDIGLMQTVILVTGIAYLAGGFIFGIALFRANVLARWAAALLAVGTLATIATGILPQYERLFAIPTGLALVGLGYSLWRSLRAPATLPILIPVSSQLDAVGAK